MCDVCADFLDLLHSYDVYNWKDEERPRLRKAEVEVVYQYIQSWSQRQCVCCFRDPPNYERFGSITQNVVLMAVCQLRDLTNSLEARCETAQQSSTAAANRPRPDRPEPETSEEPSKSPKEKDVSPSPSPSPGPPGAPGPPVTPAQPPAPQNPPNPQTQQNRQTPPPPPQPQPQPQPQTPPSPPRNSTNPESETWSLEETEKLLHFVSKVFLLNFPLYVVYKHSMQSKLEEVSAQEMSGLTVFCDLHDSEVPLHLLRNACAFCRAGGLHIATRLFEKLVRTSSDLVPVSLAHAVIAVVCNLKLWLNFRCVVQLFVPLRTCVMRYMCSLSDKELRLPGIRTMADFMWSAVRDPLDSPISFDADGLDLAFRYFTSPTLTMRLAGVAHINSHITVLNEVCGNENLIDIDSAGRRLAQWLSDRGIINHIFGPNLHVEVIKQSHLILSFLASECRITTEHVDLMWAAAQQKHCGRVVQDLLPPLVKHLEATPVLHLYKLLCSLDPRDHTEQTLYLASTLIKFIWSSSGNGAPPAGAGGIVGDSVGESTGESTGERERGGESVPEPGFEPATALPAAGLPAVNHVQINYNPHASFTADWAKLGLFVNSPRRVASFSSCDNSGSVGSNTDEEQSSPQSEAHREDLSDGPSPCKRPRPHRERHRRVHPVPDDSTDESIKIEDLEEEEEEEEGLAEKSSPDRTKCEDGVNAAITQSEEEGTGGQGDRQIPRPVAVVRPQTTLSDLEHSEEEETVSAARCALRHRKRNHGHLGITGMLRKAVKVCIHVDEEMVEGDDEDTASEDDSGIITKVPPEDRTAHPPSDKKVVVYSQEMMEELLSEPDGSFSSRVSNKSDKNELDAEESSCDVELDILNNRDDWLASMGIHPVTGAPIGNIAPTCPASVCRPAQRAPPLDLERVCRPGSTLLWDLLQDDRIGQLGEGLAMGAERALAGLLGGAHRHVRTAFIEGCLRNLAANRSVVVSLRLLPKLLLSFQQGRGLDSHQVAMWAEQQHHMMEHFFTSLELYTANYQNENKSTSAQSNPPLYSHSAQVQVRLQFLTALFSPLGSPHPFRLSLGQLDSLWQCLATDAECGDELFAWLLRQARSREMHALGPEALRHLFLRKLPSLPPEHTSMAALALYQQLCSMARLASSHLDAELVSVDHLWRVALRADSTDVSMAAIQYLNSYYMGRQLEQEGEFVSHCMNHLAAAAADLASKEEAALQSIQRALLLLKTHLETFRKRYAYHLRRWALEGRGVDSHVQLMIGDGGCQSLRVIVQPAGIPDKATLQLLSSDYVADLRAEVAKWWEALPTGGVLLGGDGVIRIITQGQELTPDYDEKTLLEMGFKDNQLVFLSVGATRPQRRRDSLDSPSVLPPPPRESLPTLLLLQPQYLEMLFTLMQTLSCMKAPGKHGEEVPHIKAQVLSRRVWDILTLLPTSPVLLQGFRKLGAPLTDSPSQSIQTLLDPGSPQKLMYSLYIVDSLSRPPAAVSDLLHSTLPLQTVSPVARLGFGSNCGEVADPVVNANWSENFVQRGGLRHLVDIFLSGVLQRSAGEGSEWRQDCLACLLRLLVQLGVSNSPADTHDIRKKVRRPRRSGSDQLLVPRLSQAMLQLLPVEEGVARLSSILQEAAKPRDPNAYKTGFWGRAQVVHFTMALLVSWVHSSTGVCRALFSQREFPCWLQRLTLEDPEPAVRREACTGIYRLCLGSSVLGSCSSSDVESDAADRSITVPLLSHLFAFLPIAESMPTPPPPEMVHHTTEDGKEPYGPACRDYFWLLCRLVDSLPDGFTHERAEPCAVDLDSLARRLANAAVQRDFLETRHGTQEDDGLIGLLNLAAATVKRRPTFTRSREGHEFLIQVFDFLFALPDPRNRYLPKCKSQASRAAAYDLLVELVKGEPENYAILHQKLLEQHTPGPHSPPPWDYWPHDDGRADCGLVGLANLGATCYMASCMQHLFMMPRARSAILSAEPTNSRHEDTLRELQRMFAYLLESERKAYNPRSFCKVYQMDHKPLNTGEQKDMAEFFIDVVSKLEEMSPELRSLVKSLFGGIISNNVVSLDCEHVSRTLEEFYTVRCQVADMRNLYDSLDEVTVKDTLDGDNMYTCSQCATKVRAEKRACFKKLPRILCFNTMRYTFNMVTMLKEKVNTHFSFPMKLDMAGYVEKTLMPQQYQEERRKSKLRRQEERKEAESKTSDNDKDGNSEKEKEETVGEESEEEDSDRIEYDLIGVTVHTGTADGGHYYSFIRDRCIPGRDKWFFFNDAEVKPFDPTQLASECFGGEMTSKTYDSVTDKFMDFSFEKTNGAYMLFYERCGSEKSSASRGENTEASASGQELVTPTPSVPFELNPELQEWIWQDNMRFLRDKNIFEHTYFNFMWQVCGYIPQTLLAVQPNVSEMATQLSATFFIETFIHAKEKPTMVQWVELLTKQLNGSQAACEWLLDHMTSNEWWPVQVLLKCPNQMVRQMFQRLCIHVISRLRPSHAPLYLQMQDGDTADPTRDPDLVGRCSCVTRFIRMLLGLLEHSARSHQRHLTEYFALLLEFAKMGEEECRFLVCVRAVSAVANFYLGQRGHDIDILELVCEDEDDGSGSPSPGDKYRPASLEKMVTLVATIVEKSRGPDRNLRLSPPCLTALVGTKGLPFLCQQTRDTINLHQTRNLVHSLSRWNERLAQLIVSTLLQAITKQAEMSQPFFKLLTLLTEVPGGAGLPCFTQLVLSRLWDVAEYAAQPALEWLTLQAPRSKLAHTWLLQGLDSWVEHFLIGHSNQRVRSAAAHLLVSLVPSTAFRQGFRSARATAGPPRELSSPGEARTVLHQILNALLRLLRAARLYADVTQHGTTRLTAYFTVMLYCTVSRTEKLMLGPYLSDLWQLFHPKLSEPAVAVHHNKQALLLYWYHACEDCPENIQLVLSNPYIVKNIAFNYILADHEDQEVAVFNRTMLPAYYGLLRLCCQQSRSFTRQLACHQNLTWAIKNITPHPTQYTSAVDELFKLMQLFVTKYPDSTEQELHDIDLFRKQTLQLYLQHLDGRSMWATLILALKTLVENDDDRLGVIFTGGLPMIFEAFHTLHVMYHEATACHVSGDIAELLHLFLGLLQTLSDASDRGASILLGCKDWADIIRRLATMLNSFNSHEMRRICMDVLKQFASMCPTEVIPVLASLLLHYHTAFQDGHSSLPLGPHFPRSVSRMAPSMAKTAVRPVRPMVQMAIPHHQLDVPKGADPDYDQALITYFLPYHEMLIYLCQLAVREDCLSDQLVSLVALTGCEAVPLHFTLFPQLWLDICRQPGSERHVELLVNCHYLVEYVEAILLDERSSLNIPTVYEFMCTFFPRVSGQVVTAGPLRLLHTLPGQLLTVVSCVELTPADVARLNGDLRALLLVERATHTLRSPPHAAPLTATLGLLLDKLGAARKQYEKNDKVDPSKETKETSEEESTEPKEEHATSSSSGTTKEETESVENSSESKPSTDDKETKDASKSVSSDSVEMPEGVTPESNVWWFYQLEATVKELLAMVDSS